MPGVAERRVAQVSAPAQVETWRSAEVRVYHEVAKGGGNHGMALFGSTTFERAAVEVWILGTAETRPIRHDSYAAKKPMLGSSPVVRRIRRGAYALAASPRGDWLAFSDAKNVWMPLHPDSLLLCPHLRLRGERPAFAALPTPRELALDVLAHAAGTQGPLGLDHRCDDLRAYTEWNRTRSLAAVTELWAAGNWARMHPDDEEVQHALAEVLVGRRSGGGIMAPPARRG